jgi:hypothetical protein
MKGLKYNYYKTKQVNTDKNGGLMEEYQNKSDSTGKPK